MPDAGGVDGLPVAGAVVSAKRDSRCRGVGDAPNQRIAAVCLPQLWADRTEDRGGSGRACDPPDGGTVAGIASVTLPDARTTVGPGIGSPAAGLTREANAKTATISQEGAENGSRLPRPRRGRQGARLA